MQQGINLCKYDQLGIHVQWLSVRRRPDRIVAEQYMLLFLCGKLKLSGVFY